MDDVWGSPFTQVEATVDPAPSVPDDTPSNAAPAEPTPAVFGERPERSATAEHEEIIATLMAELTAMRAERIRHLQIMAGVAALAIAAIIGYLDRICSYLRPLSYGNSLWSR